MEADGSARAARVLGAWCAGAAALAVLVGAATLARGWLEPRVAVCFVLSGGALWALRPPPSPLRRRIADVAAALSAVVALFAMTPGLAGLPALCFVLIAAGLLGLDRSPIFRMGQRLAVAAGFIAFLTVVASAYGAMTVGPESYAALALVVLAIGVTAARPGRGATGIFLQDTAGGTVAR